MEREEVHAITFIAENTHFTMQELREIALQDFPSNARVKLIAGHREGEFMGNTDSRYTKNRKSMIVVKLI